MIFTINKQPRAETPSLEHRQKRSSSRAPSGIFVASTNKMFISLKIHFHMWGGGGVKKFWDRCYDFEFLLLKHGKTCFSDVSGPLWAVTFYFIFFIFLNQCKHQISKWFKLKDYLKKCGSRALDEGILRWKHLRNLDLYWGYGEVPLFLQKETFVWKCFTG